MDLNEFSVASASGVNMSQELNMSDFQIVEEGPQESQSFNLGNFRNLKEGPQVSEDLNMCDLQIIEERPRVCPLCSQEIRLYFINYNEKIEMCENLECDYPFGYEPLKIVREENGVQTVEVKSITSKTARSTGCSQASSQTSSQGWADVDKFCSSLESNDIPNVDMNKLKSAAQLKKIESDRRKEELLRNVEKIKQMTKSMSETKKESKTVIKNEKWIKNLQFLQGMSGVCLLKPAEMKKIKNKSGELKIDIDKNNLSSIKIEVNHTRAGSKRV